jgi:hypothetical protein
VKGVRGFRTFLAVPGGFVVGLTWGRRALLTSFALRLLSSRRSNAAKRARIRVDLGPAVGEWSRPALVASLDHALSNVLGRSVEGAAFSRFGDFEERRPYSRFLDPDSDYYQAWLGAYVVLDGPAGHFGFGPDGVPRVDEALAVLEADQRLVYRSSGCPHRFENDMCTHPIGSLEVLPPAADGWWRLRGEAETWSSYRRGGRGANVWGRLLYGVVPENAEHCVDDYHPLRYVGEFRIRHDDELGATCCAFAISPRFVDRQGRERFASRDLLRDAGDRLGGVCFRRG